MAASDAEAEAEAASVADAEAEAVGRTEEVTLAELVRLAVAETPETVALADRVALAERVAFAAPDALTKLEVAVAVALVADRVALKPVAEAVAVTVALTPVAEAVTLLVTFKPVAEAEALSALDVADTGPYTCISLSPAFPVVPDTDVSVTKIAVVDLAANHTTPAVNPSFGKLPIVTLLWSANRMLAPRTWSFGLGRSNSWMLETVTGLCQIRRNQAPAPSPLEAHS